MKCFLGVRPQRAFGELGDSGSLVIDGEGKGIGILSACTSHPNAIYLTPPDMTHVIPLDDIFEDLKGLGLADIKFANDA